VNPRAFVRAVEAREARVAWDVWIDPAADPQGEPPEMKLGRISRGVDFELMQRRPLRV
jgi:hypothetical protein